jgi:Ni,Fe-hydrogenase maturation factor
VILDVVRGIDKPRVFTGSEGFRRTKSVTTHDLDLGSVLKILESSKGLKFRIIGIPSEKKKEEILEDVRRLISSI